MTSEPFRRSEPRPKTTYVLGMILALALALSFILAPGGRADEGLVYLLYFYDPNCSICEETHRQVLEPLMAEYSSRIVVEERSIADSANFELMIKLEQEYKVMAGGIPEVFIGQDVLVGAEEIRAKLKERIEYYLARGGDRSLPAKVLTLVPTPSSGASSVPENLCDVCAKAHGFEVPKPTPADQGAATAKAIIYAAYFYQPGCDECERAEHDLKYIQDKYPQLQVRRFDVKEEAALNQYLCIQAQVPADKHLTAPALFIGQGYLIGEQIRAPAIESLIAPYLSTGAPEPWAGWEARKQEAETAIVERFRSLRLATIAGAGLIDGINPCAFATIIFLIAYLSAYERKGREILAAGIAFSAGVFLTYIGVGFGFLRFLASLPFLNVIGKWVYGITMLLCLALAWGSIMDYFKARAGKTQEMALRLPDRFRNLTKRLIRRGASARQFVPASFVLGLVISLVELACTGQVYLPTIIFVLGIPEWRARASLALLLYNVMFILPLVVVFLLVYFGTTSEQLMAWLAKRTAAIKLVTAALFVLLAGWLAYSIIAL